MSDSLGYEKMFYKYPPPSKHTCLTCHKQFDSFTELYGHKELWHGNPILRLGGIGTIDEVRANDQPLRKLAKDV